MKLQIEPESQTQLLDATMNMEGVLLAGVPEAGGFDVIFAVTLGDSSSNVISAWSSHNVLFLLVREDPQGVSLESGDPRSQGITSAVSSIHIKWAWFPFCVGRVRKVILRFGAKCDLLEKLYCVLKIDLVGEGFQIKRQNLPLGRINSYAFKFLEYHTIRIPFTQLVKVNLAYFAWTTIDILAGDLVISSGSS